MDTVTDSDGNRWDKKGHPDGWPGIREEFDSKVKLQTGTGFEAKHSDISATIPEVWDHWKPELWSSVSATSRKSGNKSYSGDIMALVTEKHSELGNKDEDMIYKGRIAYRGDDIRDEF